MRSIWCSMYHRAVTLFAIVTLLLVPSLFLHTVIVQAAYDCFGAPGYLFTGHCYGVNEWRGSTTGAYTHMTLAEVRVDNQPGRITMEMWVQDRTHNQFVCQTEVCWVEAGYTFAAGGDRSQCQGFLHYFHAEYIHLIGYQEACDFSDISPTDLLRGDIGVLIEIDPSHTYWVYTWLTASGNVQRTVNNRMSPDTVWIGCEISGTNGAHGNQSWWDTN